MACKNCRSRKIKCGRLDSVDGSPCERCVEDGDLCEYPPDPSSASNNHTSNYQDGPVNLYHVHSAPSPKQEFARHVNQSSHVPTHVPNQALSSKYNMNSSNSNSSSPVRERRLTPMACTNCRSRKIKCRLLDSVDSFPCDRCVKDGALCEYRPVDQSSASNNHSSNYQDNHVNVYHVHFDPPPKQESAPPIDHVHNQMDPSSSNSSTPVRDRRPTPMACTNCHSHKLKCRRVDSVDGSPCERCVKDGALCEYRPDPSPASNNRTSDYQDNPVNLYHVRPKQESAFPINQGRERRRTSMVCTNCRSRKIKCRRLDSADSSHCEQCVKDGVLCEYRLVDPSSASNSHAFNYQDNSANLYPHSAPPPSQKSALPIKHSSHVPTQRGPDRKFNPAVQAFLKTNHITEGLRTRNGISTCILYHNIRILIRFTDTPLTSLTPNLLAEITPSTFTMSRQNKNPLCPENKEENADVHPGPWLARTVVHAKSSVVASIQLMVPLVSDVSKMKLCVNIVPSTQVQPRKIILPIIKITLSTFTISILLLTQNKNPLCL